MGPRSRDHGMGERWFLTLLKLHVLDLTLLSNRTGGPAITPRILVLLRTSGD